MTDTITRNGLTFRVATEPDPDHGEPWVEVDCYGVVVPRKSREAKRSNERVLASDHGWVLCYDVTASLDKARRDSWGLCDADRAALTERLGRSPTAKEVTARAVEMDYERLKAYCAGLWGYVGVIVTLLDVDGNDTPESESVWGIESDSDDDDTAVVANDLADEIAARVGVASVVKQEWTVRA